MQIRVSQLIDGFPDPKLTGSNTVHRHSSYVRYASLNSSEQVKVLRFLLHETGRTISVCPDLLPPYRPLPLDQIEAGFDERSGIVVEAPAPPLSVAEEGSLKRAWLQLGERVKALVSQCGQHLPAVVASAGELWLGLRRNLGSVRDILTFLSIHPRSSLLGDYACLQIIPD